MISWSRLLFGARGSRPLTASRPSTLARWWLRLPAWLVSLVYTLRLFLMVGLVFGVPIAIGQVAGRAWRDVYFAECMTDGGPIKIGLASDVGRRLGEVQVGCPYPIELMGTVPGGREGERLFHRLFSAFRIHGEWFWPDRIVTRTIRTLLQEQKHSRKAGAA